MCVCVCVRVPCGFKKKKDYRKAIWHILSHIIKKVEEEMGRGQKCGNVLLCFDCVRVCAECSKSHYVDVPIPLKATQFAQALRIALNAHSYTKGQKNGARLLCEHK